MTDKLTPEQRHRAMQGVHSKDTSIEIRLRKALWHRGIRYRKNLKGLPGTPDIVVTKWKIAIFCDGSFWHGNGLEAKRPIGTHREYWNEKIRRNVERDAENNRRLETMRWTVLRFWDKDICGHLDGCVSTIEEAIEEARKREKHALK